MCDIRASLDHFVGDSELASLIPLALIAPEPRHAHRDAKLPGFCLLCTCNRERALKIRFRFLSIVFRQLERDFAGNAIHFRQR